MFDWIAHPIKRRWYVLLADDEEAIESEYFDPTKVPGDDVWDSADCLEDLLEFYDFNFKDVECGFAFKNVIQCVRSSNENDDSTYQIAFAYETQKDEAAALMKELHASVMRHGRFPQIKSRDEEALLAFAVADKSIRIVKNQTNRRKIVTNLEHAPFKEAVIKKLSLRWPEVKEHRV